jgi:hypothetical protein
MWRRCTAPFRAGLFSIWNGAQGNEGARVENGKQSGQGPRHENAFLEGGGEKRFGVATGMPCGSWFRPCGWLSLESPFDDPVRSKS